MESKAKEYKFEFNEKIYIFKMDNEKLICISMNDASFFSYKYKPFWKYEIKSYLEKKEINNIKSGNENELKISYKKDDIYYEIKEYKTPNENSRKETIESNGKKFIKELYCNNIYIYYTEKEKIKKFKITIDNLDNDYIEKKYDMIDDYDIDLVNNSLRVKDSGSFIMHKDEKKDTFIEYYLNHCDEDLEAFSKKNEKLINEMKSKQSMMEKQSEPIIRNLKVMMKNAELIHFPKTRYPVQKDNGIIMDTMIITKLDAFKLIDNKLYQTFDKDVEYKLLYRASKDGDTAKIFKEKCKEKNTLTIVQTADKAIFGGFTTVPWDDSDENKDDEKAFCFSADKGKIYQLKKYCSAIGCDKGSGPRFLYMFMINNRFMAKGGELYPLNISHYNGQSEDYELNKGNKMFGVDELEVFKIKPKN